MVFLPAISGPIAAAALVPPPCASSQLMVLGSYTQGFAGNGDMTIGIANVGAACRIGGYPQVEFLNSKSVAVDRRDAHTVSMAFAEPRSVTITLGPDESASIGVSWSDNPVQRDGRSTTCPRTFSVTVNLRRGVGHLSGFLPVSASPCGGVIGVTPIEAGAWPRPNA